MDKPHDHPASLDHQLRASRLELLDIGLRNNLVSYRKTSKSMSAYDADAAQLLGVLLDQQKKLSWKAIGKARQGDAQAALDAMLLEDQDEPSEAGDGRVESLATIHYPLVPAAAKPAAQAAQSPSAVIATTTIAQVDATPHRAQASADTAVETASNDNSPSPRSGKAATQILSSLAPEPLFLQLLKLRSEAHTLMEEQGANLLFLAIGFLHWFESDSAQEARRAPLVLVPVQLQRSDASEVFEIAPTGDDVVVNLSLAAKLKTDFGIQLPLPADTTQSADGQDSGEGTDDSAAKWLAYLESVAQAVQVQKRWWVARDEAVLGLFSFGKFLMFRDLESENWPEGKKPEQHPVLARLMGSGFADQPASYGEDQHIDQIISPGEVHFVKDADSSQTLALLEACAGQNLVIQGPPGTGKSQTITNLIAELLGQKKTVLFVAEKMAALEVVKRRLDECHLGDSVLELHSHRATKAVVLKELGRTLDLGRPVADDSRQDMQRLQAVQAELNEYCAAVAAPIGGSADNFAAVLGQLLQLQAAHPLLQALAWPTLATWPDSQAQSARDLVERMALVVRSLGTPQASVWWGCTLKSFSPIDANQADSALAQAQLMLQALSQAAGALAQRVQLTAPQTLADITTACRAARCAAQAPNLAGIALHAQDWQTQREAIHALVQAGRDMFGMRQRHSQLLISEAWQQSVMPIRQAIANYGSQWWKFLSGDWRAAKKQFQGLLKTPQTMEPAAMLAVVDDILQYQEHKRSYDTHLSLGAALFGTQWQAGHSDWDALAQLSTWVIALHEAIAAGELPPSMLSFLASAPDVSGLEAMAAAVNQQQEQFEHAIAALCQQLGLTEQPGWVQSWPSAPLAELETKLQEWRAQLPQLPHVVRLTALLQQGQELGLAPFKQTVLACDSADDLLPLFQLSRTQALLEHAYAEHPALAQFDRLEQEHRIAQFRQLDLASLTHAQANLAGDLWLRMPRLSQPGEMAVLRHELNKKRRHIPIRRLIDQAGRAIQQIKPVFMMSPMSIANFLPPGKLEFDVVIFDEASQVKAVDALGAILRGKQVIVVGDTRQMPPTDFFSRDVEQDDASATSDIESILSMFKARGCHERYLRWHYRSRHESLIAVSNAEFYENKLVIFPTAGLNTDATGIAFSHLPHTSYDRGRTRTNKGEAQAVAQAVIAHARHTPHLSLGVAAFSVAQRDLIEFEVEMLRRENSEVDRFFTAHQNEPFFVKNLENIQGDERDVVFISIGYGRNESGRIAKEFGPLNREGGHRRLNVLITRAKLAMRVFSNFRADELELDHSAKHGVRALKSLLKYAETGQLEVATETGKANDSPFETQVLQALRERGYSLEPQVGTSGYFIDMAVRDPDFPGRYLLAIECDGAAYHSARSARDRDRLRQGVLEGLGWRFHRIWSTDWFRNPGQEIERAVAAIEAARLQLASPAADTTAAVTAPEATPVFVRSAAKASEAAKPQPTVPYQPASLPDYSGRDVPQAANKELDALVRKVIDLEAPVHQSLVTKRVMQAYGISRAGSRVSASVNDAIQRLLPANAWHLQDGFVYTEAQRQAPLEQAIRDRSHQAAADKKLELVSPLEIQAAIYQAVQASFSLPRTDVAATVLQWLGFGRVTANLQAVLERELAALEITGWLEEDDAGRLRVAEPLEAQD